MHLRWKSVSGTFEDSYALFTFLREKGLPDCLVQYKDVHSCEHRPEGTVKGFRCQNDSSALSNICGRLVYRSCVDAVFGEDSFVH